MRRWNSLHPLLLVSSGQETLQNERVHNVLALTKEEVLSRLHQPNLHPLSKAYCEACLDRLMVWTVPSKIMQLGWTLELAFRF